MHSLATEWFTDERLWVATLVGLATVPLTVLFSTGPISNVTVGITGVPFLLGCLIVGYSYSDRETSAAHAGRRAGIVGSLGPILTGLYRTGPELWIATPWWFGALAGVTILAAVPFFGLVGTVFAPLGDKIAKTVERDRLSASDV